VGRTHELSFSNREIIGCFIFYILIFIPLCFLIYLASSYGSEFCPLTPLFW
jgi:hypothetical protein